ncbi:MAG: ribonuclease HII [Deltaproteobacteria bacterium]|nr:MAG: ribonuclease HII [Deltaproteobacteria bacterium]
MTAQPELFACAPLSPLHFERQALARGYSKVAGVDEAGRGPLAGPVVAAAVILPDTFDLPGLTDSKQLSEKARDRLYPLIRAQALAVGIGVARVEEIDRVNILQATLRSMQRAVGRLGVPADFLLIDGNMPVPLDLPQQTLVKGDARSLSIAAASVVAKVVRDRIMVSLDRLHPGYGLAGHKGYGSAAHRAAIAALGPSPCHRRTFGGVREHCR